MGGGAGGKPVRMESTMTLTTTSPGDLASHLEARRAAHFPDEPRWLSDRRREALARFVELGIPTPQHEDWRWTNLAAPHGGGESVRVSFSRPGLAAVELVFVNGRLSPAKSRLGTLPPGATVTTLREALAKDPSALEPHLGRIAPVDRAFPALNLGSFLDGAFVAIEDGTALEIPIHVVSLTEGQAESSVVPPRSLFLLGRNARATIIETHATVNGGASWTAPVTEVRCGEGSSLSHLRLVRDEGASHHVGTVAVEIAAASRYLSHVYTLGGGLVRNESHVRLAGENADATLYGLFYGRGDQIIDNHTRLEHAAPHCRSWQVFKSILDGASRGIFDGRILVRQIAQKTDAKQTSRNLLLSDHAIADNKPQLEIYADDVKCTHGATTGQLDPEQIFYLRARGLSLDAARALLVFAFAREMVDGIPNADVRAIVEEELLAKLPMGRVIQDLS